MSNRSKTLTDYSLKAAAWFSALCITALFAALVADLFIRGFDDFSLSFILSEPERAGRLGGISSILFSTFLILSVCMAVVVPIGLGSALFLSVFTRQESISSAVVRITLDVLGSTPSIVFGLFGSAFFCLYLGLGFSILSGGLTLACMVLPTVIRMTEEGISAVPQEYRLSGAALGLSPLSLFFQVLLPIALPALVASLILGVARALSETAALLFTSGYVMRMPTSLLDSGRSLSVHIFDLAMNVPGGDANAYKSALVLLGILLIINNTAIMLSNRWAKRRISR